MCTVCAQRVCAQNTLWFAKGLCTNHANSSHQCEEQCYPTCALQTTTQRVQRVANVATTRRIAYLGYVSRKLNLFDYVQLPFQSSYHIGIHVYNLCANAWRLRAGVMHTPVSQHLTRHVGWRHNAMR